MNLDTLIPPEITVGSQLGLLLERLAARLDIKDIIETGASSGEGSTACLVSGAHKNPNHPTVYAIEMSQVRYMELSHKFYHMLLLGPFWGCSVRFEDFLTPEQVQHFYNNHKTNLNRYSIETVLGWLEQDRLYLLTHIMPTNVLPWLIETEKLNLSRTLVLLDGSAFTGLAETGAVMGAKLIVLDDTRDIKHWDSYEMLKSDTTYRLLAENPNERNGYAVFERKL